MRVSTTEELFKLLNLLHHSANAKSKQDTVSGLEFSPISIQQNYLVSGGWDNKVSCWEVQMMGNNFQALPKAQTSHNEPVLDVAWSDVSANQADRFT